MPYLKISSVCVIYNMDSEGNDSLLELEKSYG